MIRKWKDLAFVKKLILVYVLALLVVVILVTFSQIRASVSVLEEENIKNLDLLTEQITQIFDENQRSISNNLYSRITSFSIPGLMDTYNTLGRASELQSVLTQMVTSSSDYDYVMIETLNGTRLRSDARPYITQDTLNTLYQSCNELLDSQEQVTYGTTNWVRHTDGEVYIIKDIYDVSPLSRVGRMVLHMRSDFFQISHAYTDTAFLFFDRQGNFLFSAGLELSGELMEEISSGFREGTLASENVWEGEEYFTSSNSYGSWQTVGVRTMAAYRQAEAGIVGSGVICALVGLVIGVALMLTLTTSVSRKLRELRKSMNKVAEGDLDHVIQVTDNDDISQLAMTFNYMTRKVAELLEALVEKERLKKDAELQVLEYKYRSLETQIRPHFIYNALETVNSMAKIQGNQEIVDIVQRISRYFRSITINTSRQFITTQQEFDNLRDYTEIYRYIHGDHLKTTFAAREVARNAMIPTMILQPVVENALQHGLRSQEEESELIVHAYFKDNKLNITVKDNGYGLTEEQLRKLQSNEPMPQNDHGGIGLRNVRQRLNLIYGDEASFQISNREEGGVMVKIIIPFNYSEPETLYELDDLDELDELDDL